MLPLATSAIIKLLEEAPVIVAEAPIVIAVFAKSTIPAVNAKLVLTVNAEPITHPTVEVTRFIVKVPKFL